MEHTGPPGLSLDDSFPNKMECLGKVILWRVTLEQNKEKLRKRQKKSENARNYYYLTQEIMDFLKGMEFSSMVWYYSRIHGTDVCYGTPQRRKRMLLVLVHIKSTTSTTRAQFLQYLPWKS